MDFKTITVLIDSFKKHPIGTILAIFIMIIVAISAMFFSGFFTELGKKTAFDSGKQEKTHHSIQTGDIKTGDQAQIFLGSNVSISGVPHEVVDDLRNTINLKDSVIQTFIKMLEEKDVPLEDQSAKLQVSAENYKGLKDYFLFQVWVKLKKGDIEGAEKLLLESYKKNLQAIVEKKKAGKKKAAADAFGLGFIKLFKLEYYSAKQYLEQAIRLEPDNADFLNVLGFILNDLGDSQKSIDYHERALAIDLKIYGDQHSKVSTSYKYLGVACDNLGNYQKAIDYHEKALAIDLKVYGDQHPKVATSYNNLGTVWQNLGNYQKAIDYHEKALAINLKIYGVQDPMVSTQYNNLGTAWHNLGNYQKAIDYHGKALAIDLKFYGDQHPKVATSYNNLGSVWNSLGNYQKAIDYHEKALAIDLKVYGEQHSKVAISYNNLGSAWKHLGNYSKAIEYYKKALAIDLKAYGKLHPVVGIRYNNLAGALGCLGEYQKATDYFNEALLIFTSVYGTQHKYTQKIKSNLKKLNKDKASAKN